MELVVGDVTQDGVMEEAVARARSRFGKLDVMVANAGFGVSGALDELTVQDVQRQLDVNVLGVVRAARAISPR
ncbi:MAG: SDR family NAD(P)-dependent oxidoreductase [Flavobacteriales bacterium]|nr:SDR family NAD(P)-dependent oxidoreductase [Flavobacteriales bacterium]